MVVGTQHTGCDVAVIGGGPGGYLAAIRAAQRDLDVILIEAGPRLGGVCLNEGCIPSKALIHAGNLAEEIRGADRFGIDVSSTQIDMPRLIAWKDGIVERLTGGVRFLADKNGVEVVRGRARFAGARELTIETEHEQQRLSFERAIVATGSRPLELRELPVDGARIIGSREALSLSRVPERLGVVGAGYIGLELGMAYRRLGATVTVVDLLDQLLPAMDREVAKLIGRELERAGVEVRLGTRATGLTDDGLLLEPVAGGATEKVPADVVIVAVGRRPNSDGLGLADAGVEVDDNGHVVVDQTMQTSREGIYAIGDVVAGPPLAHKAYREGEVAAAAVAGEPAGFDNRAIPAVIYTDPEIAWVGLTEAEARAAGHPVTTGTFPLHASGRAMTLGVGDGMIKVVADEETLLLLGVQIVAPQASELIGQATLALEMGAFVDDVAHTIHAHPTLSEGIQEAMHLALGHAVHLPPRRG